MREQLYDYVGLEAPLQMYQSPVMYVKPAEVVAISGVHGNGLRTLYLKGGHTIYVCDTANNLKLLFG